MLLSLLFLTVASTDIPVFQQFCLFQGLGGCFAIDHVDFNADAETITVDNRDPVSISEIKSAPISVLGKTGLEIEFQTEWGSGVLIQMADDDAFTGEIPLENEIVLHIFPCVDRAECTSYGYELHEEEAPEWENEEPFSEADSSEEELAPSSAAGALARRLRRVLRSSRSVELTTSPVKPERAATAAAASTREKTSSTPTKKPSAAARSSRRTPSASVRALRRSLDSSSDCTSTTFYVWSWYSLPSFTVNVCEITVRMVFPKLVFPLNSLNMHYENFCESNAAMIVAEFNEAMDSSVNQNLENYHMKLEHLDYKQWDESKYGLDACWEYKQSHDDSDIVHCITPDGNMQQHPTFGTLWGQGSFPWESRKGTSFVTWKTLPSGSHSGSRVSAHEFGHNLGAQHVLEGNEGKTLMVHYSQLNGHNRLLKFSTSATNYHDGTHEDNAATIRNQFHGIATLH